jgi:hypothetical protein
MTLRIAALLVATISLLGLFGCGGIWAARGAAHWFWRLAAVACLLTALVAIWAEDLALLGFVEFATVVCGLFLGGAWRRWREPRARPSDSIRHSPKFQFRLSDVLLATPFVGGVLIAVPHILDRWESPWFDARGRALNGCAIGILAIVGVRAAKALQQRQWRKLLLIVVLISAAGSVVGRVEPFSSSQTRMIFLALAFIFIVFQRLGVESGLLMQEGEHVEMAIGSRRLTRSALVGFIAPMLIGFAGLICLLSPDSIPTVPPLPQPNGLDQALAVHSLFDWSLIQTRDYEELNDAELQLFARTNAAALAALESSFQQAWLIPLEWNREHWEDQWQYGGLPDKFQILRNEARALAAAGLAAEREGQLDQAIHFYESVLRFGAIMPRGGLALDRLVGNAIFSVGTHHLARIVAQLDAAQCRAALASVGANEKMREPFAVVTERLARWNRSVLPWPVRLSEWLDPNQQEKLNAMFNDCDESLIAATRLLTVELAIREYYLEENTEPAALADLVPKFLPSVPLDPFTSQPLIYRRDGAGHLLYSVGSDRRDDGGIRFDSDEQREDIFADRQ